MAGSQQQAEWFVPHGSGFLTWVGAFSGNNGGMHQMACAALLMYHTRAPVKGGTQPNGSQRQQPWCPTWSKVLRSGDSPPCTQRTRPSINACSASVSWSLQRVIAELGPLTGASACIWPGLESALALRCRCRAVAATVQSPSWTWRLAPLLMLWPYTVGVPRRCRQHWAGFAPSCLVSSRHQEEKEKARQGKAACRERPPPARGVLRTAATTLRKAC